MGYQSEEWITYAQIQRLNRTLKKGAKEAMLFYRTTEDTVNERTGEITKKEVYRPFTVFNLDEVIRPEPIK